MNVRARGHRRRSSPLFIEPGNPWEDDYDERFNGTVRDELPDGEVFCTLEEAPVLIER